jgi:hypothetical protein
MNNIEKVVWDDAGAFGGVDDSWVEYDQIIENYHNGQFLVASVGHIIYEDDDSLIMAQSHDEKYGQYSNPFRIPKVSIVKRIVLDEPETAITPIKAIHD